MKRLAPALVLVLASPACEERTLPPLGEVILHIDTDAPLPPPPGGRFDALTEPAPLFDRLKVEIYEPGKEAPCAGCSREFSVDSQQAQDLRLSLGIPLPAGREGYRARVRLYRGISTRGEPAARSSLEVVASLPAVGTEGLVDRTVFLLTETIGRPIGSLAAPIATEPGAPVESIVGTWAGARRRPCSGAPRAEEVCVPGGAFWMGNTLAAPRDRGLTADHERLVVLSPYFLDRTEVTVRAFRALRGTDPEVRAWSGKSTGDDEDDYCTFTAQPSSRDDFPLNCVPWSSARAHCTARSADLPTEAQYEYAAGALQGHTFVWGRDEPTCRGAIWGRSGWGFFAGAVSPCKGPRPGGPSTAGAGALDRLDLPTGSITDLAGNVAEWALDDWNRQEEECWSRAGVFRDPLCTRPSALDGPLKTHRGGSWVLTGPDLAAAARNNGLASGDLHEALGFRCARPD